MVQVWIWTWFPFLGYWIWVPTLYGYDCQFYVRYPNDVGDPSEAQLYVEWLWFDQWYQWNDWKNLVQLLGIIGSGFMAAIAIIFSGGALIPVIATIIGFEIQVVSAAMGYTVDEVFQHTWDVLIATYLVNNENDPNFGVETMQRFHYVFSPKDWDPMSFMTYHFAEYNGLTFQVVPYGGGVIPFTCSEADICWLGVLDWISVYPQDTWVWIGPLNTSFFE